jgi:signal transduction histidine kinase/CheY-like chemotaxis protein/HAMP domain-containing protein
VRVALHESPPPDRKNGTSASERKNGKSARSPKKSAELDPEEWLEALLTAIQTAARGDFKVRVAVPRASSTSRDIALAFNEWVAQNAAFEKELLRVERAVGREGRLTERVRPTLGAEGAWERSVEAVNALMGDLIGLTTEVARVIGAVGDGDLSQKVALAIDGRPLQGEFVHIASNVNAMVDQLSTVAAQVASVAKEVGNEGKLGGQASVPNAAGLWRDLIDNVNQLATNLTVQVRNIAEVTTAVAYGDLSKKITVDARGELLELKNTINTMVDQLRSFASEVTRVAKEVGTDGKLGGQAEVSGVAGVWKNLTDNVNFMARNLTGQVRGIVRVVTAVANGDLSQKFMVDGRGEGPGLVGVEAKGEIAALADTINGMCDTLGTFADQVTTVAREVGIEGKLGGQAKVPRATGTWRQLTDNVNQLAANLTGQVRAISDVAQAVTDGDLTRSIDVQAAGEVALLKDTINQMIGNLRETTRKNTEQDWLKTNLARFSSMLQGQKDLQTVSEMIMSELTPLVSAHHGAFFLMENAAEGPALALMSTYAYRQRKGISNRFRMGEGLIGQCAREKKTILLTRVPPDYVQISSGLGEATPLSIIVLPVLFEGAVLAVIELASFHTFSDVHERFLDQLTGSLGVVLNMITSSMRTEELLLQSQSLTQELQSQSKELQTQQQELRRTNLALEKQTVELEEKARLLAEQNEKVEIKNREVEQARSSLEEKAEQLALASKYKSEFVANMSHELRTPLNSLLILARMLADNGQGNLSTDQVEYARTIYASGTDLLTLINEILDLSKVEAGKMQIEPRGVLIPDLVQSLRRGFQPLADQKRLALAFEVDSGSVATMLTDPDRLQQVLKNLLSNAFKFTDQGSVSLTVRTASSEERARLSRDPLRSAQRVVVFSVSDTGIGIPADKQKLIFEAFQQADGTTSRKYGGTGLGLSISRELTRLLGGELHVVSAPGRGSTFTLYLPETFTATARDASPAHASPRRTPSSPPPRDLREGTPHETPRAPDSAVDGAVHGVGPASTSLPLLEPSTAIRVRPLEDDRADIQPGDRVLLVIEDDESFAGILAGTARQAGFKVVVATRGDTGLTLAAQLRPSAITLDVHLPVQDGWTVLDRLKRNPLTRHIPVHVISVLERDQKGASLGAFAYLEKPVTKDALDGAFAHLRDFVDRSIRMLLLVEDNATEQSAIATAIREMGEVELTAVGSAEDALAALETRRFDCMVVDLVLPGLDGVSLIADLKHREEFRDLPIVVFTGKDLEPEEERKIKRFASSIVVKSGLASFDELAKQTNLFLHQVAAPGAPAPGEGLAGLTILVVDDDVRNIFALSSALESQGAAIVYAQDGRSGLEALEQNEAIDVILMDIMMPHMDGYETMAAIRKDPRYDGIPIIAITANALKEDRQRCVDAGASDYLAKPVDLSALVGCVRRWTAKPEPRRNAS